MRKTSPIYQEPVMWHNMIYKLRKIEDLHKEIGIEGKIEIHFNGTVREFDDAIAHVGKEFPDSINHIITIAPKLTVYLILD